MTILNKLDWVLEALFRTSGNNPNYNIIENWLKENKKEIHRGEIQDCLLYLHQERYIYCEVDGVRTANFSDWKDARYLINVRGKYLFETMGGFVKKERWEKWRRIGNIINSVGILIATIAIAIGTFFLVRVEQSAQSKKIESKESPVQIIRK